MDYLESTVRTPVPQHQPLNAHQIPNHAGGYAYAIKPFEQLRRFLILGTEGGTYYVGERDLTRAAIGCIDACITADATEVQRLTEEVSGRGLAPSNDPALFVLAKLARAGKMSWSALPTVARTASHLFRWMSYYKALGGKSNRAIRSAIARWYTDRAPDQLAYQMAKYQNRYGWSHKDLLRVAHPHPEQSAHAALFKWAVKGGGPDTLGSALPKTIVGLEFAKLRAADGLPVNIETFLEEYGLSWEMLPTEYLGKADTWEALLRHRSALPLHAMIRNLGRMTQNGAINTFGNTLVTERLADAEKLARARVHPIAIVKAMQTYASGKGDRGRGTWTPAPSIIAALEGAFDLSFGQTPKTTKRLCIAIDLSGSMTERVKGLAGMEAREAAALCALYHLRTAPNALVIGFDSSGMWTIGERHVYQPGLSSRSSLREARTWAIQTGGGGTDLSLPFVWALDKKIPFDAFVIYTDNETWAGRSHVEVALEEYRQRMHLPAKVVNVAMTATNLTAQSPTDPGVLEVVGMDVSVPDTLAHFVNGDV
jgi:60 kDa SS-A/Ro ribonucleoprotein